MKFIGLQKIKSIQKEKPRIKNTKRRFRVNLTNKHLKDKFDIFKKFDESNNK